MPSYIETAENIVRDYCANHEASAYNDDDVVEVLWLAVFHGSMSHSQFAKLMNEFMYEQRQRAKQNEEAYYTSGC